MSACVWGSKIDCLASLITFDDYASGGTRQFSQITVPKCTLC